jgi:hypothetical protein
VVAVYLARRVPHRVPPLVAHDLERGWMIMADGGRRMREVVAEERDLSRWDDVIEAAADIARAMEPDVEESTGSPGLRRRRPAELSKRPISPPMIRLGG